MGQTFWADIVFQFLPIKDPNVQGQINLVFSPTCSNHETFTSTFPRPSALERFTLRNISNVLPFLPQTFSAWDKKFIERFVDQPSFHAPLHDLIMAANFLDVKLLLDLCCQKVADLIKGKTPEEIVAEFNLPKPEENGKDK